MSYEKMKPEDIRHHKGRSFVGVTTVFMCHDGEGKYFLHQRSDKCRDEKGRWDFGGGGLKHGFTAEENIKREVEEEYGTTPIEVEFLGYRDMFRADDDGIPTHWLALDFKVKVNPSEVRINEPEMAIDSGWYKLEDFPTPMHSQSQITIDKYRDRL